MMKTRVIAAENSALPKYIKVENILDCNNIALH